MVPRRRCSLSPALSHSWPPGQRATRPSSSSWSLPSLAIYFLYHPILEVALQGQTPGKRIAGVRVVALAHGGAPGIGAILIRNVFRLVDSLPFLYAIGLVTTIVTRHAVRIGDIAAGTVLVYDEAPRSELLDQLGGGVQRSGSRRRSSYASCSTAGRGSRRPRARSSRATCSRSSASRRAPDDDAALRAKLQELVA